MPEAVLVINAGSSSVKFAAFPLDRGAPSSRAVLRGQVAGIGAEARFQVRAADGAERNEQLEPAHGADHKGAIRHVLEWIERHRGGLRWRGVGHRVVHGGRRERPALFSDALFDELRDLSPLAPQHQPHNLEALRAIAAEAPGLPQVACFDTAFHTSQPEVARLLPLPQAYRSRGLERYGFHGLSYQHVVSVLPDCTGVPLPRRLIIAHLGNGASVCAVREGRSVATSMGFSTLDGLLMGTRCGAIDPGVLLYLMGEGMTERQLTDLLYRRSGLLGVSGISSDMRTLLESDRPEAAQAVELFVYTLVRSIGSMTAALGGLDALVFTGGIGEHAAAVRAAACRQLEWLGVVLDQDANADHRTRVSAANSTVPVWIVPANEELVIARQTAELLGAER